MASSVLRRSKSGSDRMGLPCGLRSNFLWATNGLAWALFRADEGQAEWMAQLNGCVAAEPPFGPGLGASIPACFAPSVIAADLVKPCDRGIFQALDSLLKTEQKAPGRSCAFAPASRL